MKPWKRRMWCIQRIDSEYRKRMYDLLDLYSKKGKQLHIIAIDEKPKEIHSDSRKPVPGKPGSPEKYDYEYIRKGKANIFIAIGPQRGKRKTKVTLRRTKKDFACFIKDILEEYPNARKLHLVMDNLNTHFPKSIIETFGEHESKKMLSRIEFHYTPKHASWLNMAEIEINVMDTECTGRRFDSKEELERSVKAWERRRNRKRCRIKWNFTKEKADKKLSKYYTE